MKAYRILPIVFLLVLVAGLDVQAQDWGQVMTPDRPLNVRKGRSLNTDRVTTIMPGERVRVDFSKGDWSAVFPLSIAAREESNAIGYVKTKYLQPAEALKNADWGKLVAPKGMLNVREKRDRKSEHMVTLREGQVVRIDFERNGWVAVFKPDTAIRDEKLAMGYARSKYLFPATKTQLASIAKPANVEPEAGKPAAPDSASSSSPIDESPNSVSGKVNVEPVAVKPEPVASWGRVVTLKRRANVRSDRTAGARLVSTLKEGDQVRVDFLKRGWYAAFRLSETRRDEKKAIGYIYAPLLGEPTPELNVQSLNAAPADIPAEVQQPEPKLLAEVPEQTHSEPAPAQPMSPSVSSVGKLDGKDHMTITPVDEGKTPHKGPVPRADKVRHGFKYGIIERSTGSNPALGKVLVKVFVELTVIPDDKSMRDFARTVFKEEVGDAKEMLILLYLPGQDTKDLAYGQAKFDNNGLQEFWTRRATLYGTPLLP